MIKNIILDIGGVLQGEDWDYAASKLRPVKAVSGSELRSAIQKDRVNHLNLYETGKISDNEYYSFVLANLEMKVDNNSKVLFRESLKNVWTEVNYDLLEMIKHMMIDKKLLLSNSFPELEENVKEKGYLKHFSTVYFSHRVGLKKPEKSFFLYVLKKEGIKPEETLFIDNKDENVIAAESVGIKAILYKSNSQLAEALRKYQVIQ